MKLAHYVGQLQSLKKAVSFKFDNELRKRDLHLWLGASLFINYIQASSMNESPFSHNNMK